MLGSTELGWFKIGQSQDLLGRLGGYRSYPFLIDVVYAWSVDGMRCREVEKALHALAGNKRIRANRTYSEWFKLDILDIHVLRETMRDYVYFVNSSPFVTILRSKQHAVRRTTPPLFRVPRATKPISQVGNTRH